MSDEFTCIAGWQKNSYIDFPQNLSTVLFLGGCNLRCPYCHNPDIVLNRMACVPFSDIRKFLQKRSGIIEGVVLSGGEPTLQLTLPAIVHELRKEKLKIKIDTNGLNPNMIEVCQPDYLAVDVKTKLWRYAELGCQVPEYESKLMRSLEIVRSMGERAEVRITVAPVLIDEDTIVELAKILKGVARVYLQQSQHNVELLEPDFKKHAPVPMDTIKYFRHLISPHVGACLIRGE